MCVDSTLMLKSATMSGRDILDLPIDLVQGAELDDVVLKFTDRFTEVSGRLTDVTGRAMKVRRKCRTFAWR